MPSPALLTWKIWMAPFGYLSALQSWILFKIDSMALFRASRFLAVPWCGVKYLVITSVSGAKLHNPTSSDAKSSRRSLLEFLLAISLLGLAHSCWLRDDPYL